MSETTMRLTEKRVAERAMFLQGCYYAANGRSLTSFDYVEVGSDVGLNPEESKHLAVEMLKRGFVEGIGFEGSSACLTTAGLDVVEQIELMDTPPPRTAEVKTMISNPSNCVINIESRVVNSRQAVEIAQEKWWSVLGSSAKQYLLGLLA